MLHARLSQQEARIRRLEDTIPGAGLKPERPGLKGVNGSSDHDKGEQEPPQVSKLYGEASRLQPTFALGSTPLVNEEV